MIHSLWSGKNKLYWLLVPFSWLYGLIVYFRKWAYRIGLFRSYKAPVPIIVIGNLSVGGNGKTPLVIYLAEQLSQKGVQVGIISRGYGGKSTHYPFIVNAKTSTTTAGDEPILIFNRTHCPIAISPNRVEAAQFLCKQHPEINLILSDDGLQHYRIKRDIEMVVIDTQKGFGNGHYLPAGPLREKPTRLDSVPFIILNGENKNLVFSKPTYQMTLIPKKAINLQTKQSIDATQLTEVIACAGIGDPDRFFKTLQNLNLNLQQTHAFVDHHVFKPAELLNLATTQQNLIMTEKDAVKCFAFAQANWWYLPIEAHLPDTFLTQLLEQLDPLLKQ